MLNLGMTEILLFAIITLIVLGPEKLPEAARFAGRWYGKLKRLVSNVQHDIDRELRMSELREQMQQELNRIQQLEEKMQLQMAQLQKHDLLVDNVKTEQTTLSAAKSFTFCNQRRFQAPFLMPQPTAFSTSTFELKNAV